MKNLWRTIAKKLEHLGVVASEARQTEITTELLDLVAGSEAMTGA
jgi:F0F1-type ATP synthase gamma subunit